MGYGENNAPKGLTIIGKPFSEEDLYSWAFNYEKVSNRRISPEDYNE
ncbi:hypothetical protein [Antarcticibacterium sp. 1MA-6-2]|nr:hypothetical protein [Antarcticibacterium sp. 1MA-6-2]